MIRKQLIEIITISILCVLQPASSLEGESHSVKLRWRIKDDTLIVICKVLDPFLPIVIYKETTEEARCVPLPVPVCNNNIPRRSVSFIKLTNETIYTIRQFKPETVNGEWSCSHGSGGKNPRDSQQVNICDNCAYVYVAVLLTQLCIFVLTTISQQCIKIRKTNQGNNTNNGRVVMCKLLRQMLKNIHHVYALCCIRTRSFNQIVLRVTICGLFMSGYFAIVIHLVEHRCIRENITILLAACMGAGLLIDIPICIIWTTMEDDEHHEIIPSSSSANGQEPMMTDQ